MKITLVVQIPTASNINIAETVTVMTNVRS
jgi:hypothetical protein